VIKKKIIIDGSSLIQKRGVGTYVASLISGLAKIKISSDILIIVMVPLNCKFNFVSKKHIKIKLVFFDVKNIGTNAAVFHKNVSVTQIIAMGEIYDGDKLLKKSIQKGESKEISQSTLLIAEDGSFNQQTASIALKKVCELIVKDLTK
jgi:hypothetical protein